MNAHTYWYSVVSGPTPPRQGDIYVSFLAPIITQVLPDQSADGGARAEFVTEEAPWVVLDASCDVDYSPPSEGSKGRKPSCARVLLAPLYPAIREKLGTKTDKELNERLEVMRRGDYPSKLLLPGHPEHLSAANAWYVEYRNRTLVPHAYLVLDPTVIRLRLNHPFREHLGNWVGACISRVGIEDGQKIPPYLGGLHDPHRLNAVRPEDLTSR